KLYILYDDSAEYIPDNWDKVISKAIQALGVCSLRDFEVARREEELTIETIEKNLRILKGDLKKSKARYANILRKRLGNVNPSELSWCDPLASQVLSSEMEMVKKLPEDDYKSFMEPVKHMQVALPHSIETVCDDFLTNYDDGSMEIPSQKLSHKNWGEREEVLRDIAVRILDTLGEIWKNPAFSPKFAKTQSEGTYIADIIVPVIRATLKNLPIGKSAYISTGCKLEEKDEFAILRFQVAGRKFNLYVLIRDHERISRLFLLKSVNIPTQFTNDRKAIFEFIETLLLLRRILIVDLSLLFNSVTHESDESSSTMSSPPPN
ncbi:9953_t:CDS:2, partial [Entrophospora sp. SA101]